MKSISIQWHDSPQSVHRAMWEPVAASEGITYEGMMSDSVGVASSADGVDFELSYADEMAALESQGCWAFVDTEAGVIHAWVSPDVPRLRVVHMFAHEIGHMVGTPLDDDIAEEMRAEEFGRVAAMAFDMMMSIEQQTKAAK